jgi:hypothetical protein
VDLFSAQSQAPDFQAALAAVSSLCWNLLCRGGNPYSLRCPDCTSTRRLGVGSLINSARGAAQDVTNSARGAGASIGCNWPPASDSVYCLTGSGVATGPGVGVALDAVRCSGTTTGAART